MLDNVLPDFLTDSTVILLVDVLAIMLLALWLNARQQTQTLNAQHHILQDEYAKQQQTLNEALSAKQTLDAEYKNLETQQQQLHVDLAVSQEKVQHLQTQLQQQLRALQQAQSEQQQQQAQLNQLNHELTSEQTQRQQQALHMQEKLSLLESNKHQLLNEFEQLSEKIFKQKQQEFQQQNKQSLGDILTPFKEQLSGLQKKVEDVHIDDVKDRAGLKTQLEKLHQLNQQITSEAHALTNALRGENKTQGNWGELILERVLESSGLREGHEYQREQSFHDEQNKRLRPDVIINLPENRHIIVDSKVSLNAYSDYVKAEDKTQQAAYLKAHIHSIKQHINSLSDKSYQHLNQLNSPDFVFLFMPIEPAFMLAFAADESLFQHAFKQNIVVVTPTTLLATLRTVASIWALEKRNKNTEELVRQGSLVYEKLNTIVQKMEKLGTQLKSAQNSYNEAFNSFKTGGGNLISRVDKFRKLGVTVKKQMDNHLVEDALIEDKLNTSPTTDDGECS